MTAMMALPKDHPVMLAWEAYKTTPEYANSRNWAKHDEHLDGSMWAAFLRGYEAGVRSFRAQPTDKTTLGYYERQIDPDAKEPI